jgi:hypothetical protein
MPPSRQSIARAGHSHDGPPRSETSLYFTVTETDAVPTVFEVEVDLPPFTAMMFCVELTPTTPKSMETPCTLKPALQGTVCEIGSVSPMLQSIGPQTTASGLLVLQSATEGDSGHNVTVASPVKDSAGLVSAQDIVIFLFVGLAEAGTHAAANSNRQLETVSTRFIL